MSGAEAPAPPRDGTAATPSKVNYAPVLVAPGERLFGNDYAGTKNPTELALQPPSGFIRHKSVVLDADGKAVVKPRQVGLPQGWPNHETLSIDTAGKDMWKSGWKLHTGDPPPWDRRTLMTPPSTLEGPPTSGEFDSMRYAGHAPAPRMWDGAAMGSMHGLRGPTSRRDSSRLFGDYQRRQAGAGFVPGLETPPPNMRRTWSKGEVRAPEVGYDPWSVNREGLFRLFSGELSAEAYKKGLTWSLRVPLVNAYASAVADTDEHYDHELKVTREKFRSQNGDTRPVMQHFYYAHGRAQDLEDPDLQEQIEIEDLLEQLRLERGMVLRWVHSLQRWAGKQVGAPRDFGVGSTAWALRRWKDDYCASEAWALDMINQQGWAQIVPGGFKQQEVAMLDEAQSEVLSRQKTLTGGDARPAPAAACPADAMAAPARKDSYFETLHVQDHRHLFTRLQELQLPEEALSDLERDLAPLTDVRREVSSPNATAVTAAAVAAAAQGAGAEVLADPEEVGRDLESGPVDCRATPEKDSAEYCRFVGTCGQCTHPTNFLFNVRRCAECEATKLQLDNSRWEHELAAADERWHAAFVREEMAPHSWLGWAHRKFKDELCNRGSAWVLRMLANEQKFMRDLLPEQQHAMLDVDGHPPVQAFANQLLTASAKDRLKSGFFAEILGGKGDGLMQDRASEDVLDEAKCFPAEQIAAGEEKRRGLNRLNREMLRKHYLNHAAEVVRMAPMLRQKHFEWAKWDFIPVCERYHRTRNALAYRGAANEALRYGPNSWREWLANPVKIPVRRRKKDGTPLLQYHSIKDGDNDVEAVVRDELSGLCAPGFARRSRHAPEADYCLPRFSYDMVDVYSPTLVDELLQDERNKALADISWWFEKELSRIVLEMSEDTNRPYYRGEALSEQDKAVGYPPGAKPPPDTPKGRKKMDAEDAEPNPFTDVKDKDGQFNPVAPRLYPMERRGYSIFGGVFRKKEPAEARAEKPLPQISDQLWPKYGTHKWGPLGKLGASDVGDHTVLEGEMSTQAPTYDSRGHVVPIDTRRQRVTAVTTMWDTVPTNRMPHVPYPRMPWPQARVFDTPHLAKGAPWKSDWPLVQRATAQNNLMADQRAQAEKASSTLPLPKSETQRERIFEGWHTTHEGGTV